MLANAGPLQPIVDQHVAVLCQSRSKLRQRSPSFGHSWLSSGRHCPSCGQPWSSLANMCRMLRICRTRRGSEGLLGGLARFGGGRNPRLWGDGGGAIQDRGVPQDVGAGLQHSRGACLVLRAFRVLQEVPRSRPTALVLAWLGVGVLRDRFSSPTLLGGLRIRRARHVSPRPRLLAEPPALNG